jgi:hypothetical protein
LPSFDALPAEQLEIDAKIGKDYAHNMRQLDNMLAADMTLKIMLKDTAVATLPEELQAEALIPDTTMTPLNRHPAFYTPPIEGFDITKLENINN